MSTERRRPDLAVVVPCLNEEKWIGRCLDSLLFQRQGALAGKVVVVDNGSTDRTLEIVRAYGERVRLLSLPGVGISALRNHGAAACDSRWLGFVDADVEVAAGWLDAVSNRIGALERGSDGKPSAVFGCAYGVPVEATWIEKVWYGQLEKRDRGDDAVYINAGNLIVPRHLFERLGGFDRGCVTGEDVRLCEEARGVGARVLLDRAVAAIHYGYPKSLLEFFRRERWHGRGMERDLGQPLKSKPLLLAAYNLLLLVLLLAAAGIGCGVPAVAFLTGWLLASLTPVGLLAARRSSQGVRGWALLTLLYLVYGWARTVALAEIMGHRLETVFKRRSC